MIEAIIEELVKNGGLGIMLAYFIYKDYEFKKMFIKTIEHERENSQKCFAKLEGLIEKVSESLRGGV